MIVHLDKHNILEIPVKIIPLKQICFNIFSADVIIFCSLYTISRALL